MPPPGTGSRRCLELGKKAIVQRYFAPGKAALLSVGEQIATRSASGRPMLNVLASVSHTELLTGADRERGRSVRDCPVAESSRLTPRMSYPPS